MLQSVRFPQWKEAIRYVAERWTASGTLQTLIPNLFVIDADHRWYEHYKYPIGHPMKQ